MKHSEKYIKCWISNIRNEIVQLIFKRWTEHIQSKKKNGQEKIKKNKISTKIVILCWDSAYLLPS